MKEKLEYLNSILAPKEYNQISKFMTTLFIIPIEQIKANVDLLQKSGIEIKKSSQIKLCVIDTNILEKRINWAKNNNLMQDVVINPLLLFNKEMVINEEKTKEANDEEKISKDNIEQILDSDLTAGLSEEGFYRYQLLSSSCKAIVEEINTKSLVFDDRVNDNLAKLITNNVLDDKKVIFAALTYKRNYSAELLDKINSVIEAEYLLDKVNNSEMRLAA